MSATLVPRFKVGGPSLFRVCVIVCVAGIVCTGPAHGDGRTKDGGRTQEAEDRQQVRLGSGRIYKLPPEELQDSIMAILARPPLQIVVIAAGQGVIETSYEEYPGAYFGILWWRKRWQRRTRYVFTVEHAWEDSTYSRLIWNVHTETRPNSSYAWQRESFVPGRLVEILAVLDHTLKGGE